MAFEVFSQKEDVVTEENCLVLYNLITSGETDPFSLSFQIAAMEMLITSMWESDDHKEL